MCGALCKCGKGEVVFDGMCSLCICEQRTELRAELEKTKELFGIATMHCAEYKAWVEKAEAEIVSIKNKIQMVSQQSGARGLKLEDRGQQVAYKTGWQHALQTLSEYI